MSIPEQLGITMKDKYFRQVDDNGFLMVSAFATTEFRRQSKSIAAFLDGDGGSFPERNLGDGIRFKGDSGNYTDVKIHIDDLDEFVRRVKNYYGE